jgi:hypothetical protein
MQPLSALLRTTSAAATGLVSRTSPLPGFAALLGDLGTGLAGGERQADAVPGKGLPSGLTAAATLPEAVQFVAAAVGPVPVASMLNQVATPPAVPTVASAKSTPPVPVAPIVNSAPTTPAIVVDAVPVATANTAASSPVGGTTTMPSTVRAGMTTAVPSRPVVAMAATAIARPLSLLPGKPLAAILDDEVTADAPVAPQPEAIAVAMTVVPARVATKAAVPTRAPLVRPDGDAEPAEEDGDAATPVRRRKGDATPTIDTAQPPVVATMVVPAAAVLPGDAETPIAPDAEETPDQPHAAILAAPPEAAWAGSHDTATPSPAPAPRSAGKGAIASRPAEARPARMASRPNPSVETIAVPVGADAPAVAPPVRPVAPEPVAVPAEGHTNVPPSIATNDVALPAGEARPRAAVRAGSLPTPGRNGAVPVAPQAGVPADFVPLVAVNGAVPASPTIAAPPPAVAQPRFVGEDVELPVAVMVAAPPPAVAQNRVVGEDVELPVADIVAAPRPRRSVATAAAPAIAQEASESSLATPAAITASPPVREERRVDVAPAPTFVPAPRERIAGEGSAPVVTVAAPTIDASATPAPRERIVGEADAPVVMVAAADTAPARTPVVTSATLFSRIAEVAVQDRALNGEVPVDRDAAPARRREGDAPTPAIGGGTLDAATPRPVAAASAAGQGTLDTRSDEWMKGMIDRIETMRGEGARGNETRIRLSPDALGSVEIAIHHGEDGMQVRFASDNPDAARLLSDAQPRLAELAEARGLKLGGMQVDVGGQRQQRAPSQDPPAGQTSNRTRSAEPRGDTPSTDTRIA